MSIFLKRYVREPLEKLLSHADSPLDELRLRWDNGDIALSVGDETLLIRREPVVAADTAELPVDVDEELPGI